MRSVLILLLMLCVGGQALARVPLNSLSPAEDVPGAEVILRGGPFDGTVRVIMGNERIRPTRVYSRHLFFEIPELEPGEYSVTVVQGGELSPNRFTFRVIPPKPAITALRPWKFYACSSPIERELQIELENFRPGASLLLNGSAIPFEVDSANRIRTELPRLSEGLHEIRVTLPNDASSLPTSIYFDATPQIFSVEEEADNVNSYSLLIHGRNFYATSRLAVSNRLIAPLGEAVTARDHIDYIDCKTLRYTRYPNVPDEEPVELRIVNPDGRQSPPYSTNLR